LACCVWHSFTASNYLFYLLFISLFNYYVVAITSWWIKDYQCFCIPCLKLQNAMRWLQTCSYTKCERQWLINVHPFQWLIAMIEYECFFRGCFNVLIAEMCKLVSYIVSLKYTIPCPPAASPRSVAMHGLRSPWFVTPFSRPMRTAVRSCLTVAASSSTYTLLHSVYTICHSVQWT